MRFLLDMGISPRVAEFLRGKSYTAAHLSDLGLATLPDTEIFEKARTENFVLLTHDLDFVDIVAASGSVLPSVVLFRLSSMRPENVNQAMLLILENHQEALQKGAIISVDDRRIRVRLLPIEMTTRSG